MLGTPVNALYKGMCSDLVGSLHLIVVNARFNKDPLFSLGLVAALDLVLKNYPEQDTAKNIKTAIIESVGLSEADIDAEAAKLEEWAKGKTQDDISNALKGEGDSPLSDIAKAIKGEEWWMYSKFFGIGLVRLMEIVGVEQDMSVAYDVMENWVGKCLEKPYYTACVSLPCLRSCVIIKFFTTHPKTSTTVSLMAVRQWLLLQNQRQIRYDGDYDERDWNSWKEAHGWSSWS